MPSARDARRQLLGDRQIGLHRAQIAAVDAHNRAGQVEGPDPYKSQQYFQALSQYLKDLRGEKGAVSSTAIRTALSDGDPRAAADMLGHWHRIEGPVLHGEKRGRQLGYPTANMELSGLHVPKLGVYAVVVDVLTGPHAGSYHGVANLGIRPMFERPAPNLETFLFDFSGDLYEQHLSVGLVAYLRPEMAFDGLDPLIVQMDADSAAARDALADV